MVKANERRYVVKYEAKDFEKAIANIQDASAEFTKLIGSSTSLLKNLKTVSSNFKINPKVDTTEVNKLQTTLKENQQIQVGLAGVQDLKNSIHQLEISTKINLARFQAYKREVSESISPPEKKPFAYYQLNSQNQRMADVNIYELRRIRQAIVDGQNRKNFDRVGNFVADTAKVGGSLTGGILGGVTSTALNAILFPIQSTLFGLFSKLGQDSVADISEGFFAKVQKQVGVQFYDVGGDLGDTVGEAVYRTYENFYNEFREAISSDRNFGSDKFNKEIDKVVKSLFAQLALIPVKLNQRIKQTKQAVPEVMTALGELQNQQPLTPQQIQQATQKGSVTFVVGGQNMDETAGNTEFVNRLLTPLLENTVTVPFKNFASNQPLDPQTAKFLQGLVSKFLTTMSRQQMAGLAEGMIPGEKAAGREVPDLESATEEDLRKFIVKQFASGATPASNVLGTMLKGYNLDDVNLAAQILQYKQAIPDLPVNIVGTSGGGGNVARALGLLKLSGVSGVKGVGVSSPSLLGTETLNTGEDYTNIIGEDDFLYTGVYGDKANTGLVPPQTTQIVPKVGRAHLLSTYLGDPKVQAILRSRLQGVGIKKGAGSAEVNALTRLVQSEDQTQLINTLMSMLGDTTARRMSPGQIQAFIKDYKKKANKVDKKSDFGKYLFGMLELAELLAEEVKLFEVLGESFTPVKSIKKAVEIASGSLPELAQIDIDETDYPSEAEITQAMQTFQGIEPLVNFMKKITEPNEIGNIERTFKAMAGEKTSGYSFFDKEEYQVRSQEHLGGLINYLESDLLSGASPESMEKAKPYLDLLKELQSAIVAKGQGGEYNTKLAQKAADLFGINLPGATPRPRATSSQINASRAIAENPFLGMSPEAKLLNLETRVSTEQAAEAYRSLTNIRGQRTPQELTNKVRQFRDAIRAGDKRLATSLGLNILRDIKAYGQAIEEIRQDPNANIREAAIVSLQQQFTAIANEIKRGSASRGRTPVGQGLLDLIEQNEQEVIETIESKVLEELEIRRLAIEAQQSGNVPLRSPSDGGQSLSTEPGTSQGSQPRPSEEQADNQLRRNPDEGESGYFIPGAFIPDFSKINKTAQNFFANLLKNNRKSLKQQSEELKQYLEETRETVEAYIQRLQNLLNHPLVTSDPEHKKKIEQDLKLAQKVLNYQKSLKNSRSLASDLLSGMRGFAKIPSLAIAEYGKAIISAFPKGKFKELLESDVLDLLNSVQNKFKQTSSEALNFAEATSKTVNNIVVEQTQRLKAVSRMPSQFISKTGDIILSAIPQGRLKDLLESDLLVLLKTLEDRYNQTSASALRFADSTKQAVKSLVIEQAQRSRPLLAVAASRVSASLKAVPRLPGRFISKAGDSIMSALPEGQFKDLLGSDVFGLLNSGQNKLKQTFADTLESLQNTKRKIGFLVKEIVSEQTQKLRIIPQIPRQAVSKTSDAFMSMLPESRFKDLLGSNVFNLLARLQDRFKQTSDKAISFAQTTKQAIKSVVVEQAQRSRPLLEATSSRVSASLKVIPKLPGQAISKAGETILSKLPEGRLKNLLGSDALERLKKLEDRFKQAADKALKFAQTTKKTIFGVIKDVAVEQAQSLEYLLKLPRQAIAEYGNAIMAILPEGKIKDLLKSSLLDVLKKSENQFKQTSVAALNFALTTKQAASSLGGYLRESVGVVIKESASLKTVPQIPGQAISKVSSAIMSKLPEGKLKDLLGSDVLDIIKKSESQVKKSSEVALKSAQSTSTAIKNVVEQQAKKLLEFTPKIPGKIVAAYSKDVMSMLPEGRIKNFLGSDLSKLLKNVQDRFKQTSEAASLSAQRIKKAVSDVTEQANKKVLNAVSIGQSKTASVIDRFSPAITVKKFSSKLATNLTGVLAERRMRHTGSRMSSAGEAEPTKTPEFNSGVPMNKKTFLNSFFESLDRLKTNVSEKWQRNKLKNPVKEFIDEVSGSADDFNIDVNSIARNYSDLIQGLYRFNPLLGNIAELIQNLVVNFGEMAAAQVLINIWQQIGNQAVELVRQLQNVERAINTLTSGKGESSMDALGEISKRTSTDLLVLADSYKQLVAATKGTSFEPFAMRFIDSFASLASSYGLDEQQKKQALTAFTQVFGKGKLQAEELTGQLAEAAPGFPQVIARGLGLTQEQLLQKVSEGGISATDAGLAFMRQAASEAGDVSQSYNTLQGSVNRLTNAQFNLNKTLGEETAPKFVLLKNILAFLTEQTVKFVPIINLLLSTLTVFLTGKAIETFFGLGASMLGITKNTVGFVRVLKVLQAAFTALMNYVKSFVGVSTIGAVVLIEVWSSALQAVRQGTLEVDNANKSLAESLKKVAQGYREVKDASAGAGFQATDSTNRAVDFVYNTANSFLDLIGGGKEARERREKATGQREFKFTTFGETEFATNILKTSDSVDKAYSINQIAGENLTQDKLNATSNQIKELDKRKATVEQALKYAQRNKNQADIDKYKAELVDLEKQKQQAIDEVNTYQGQVESARTQLKNLLNYWKDLANNPDLTSEQQQQATAQVKLLEKALDDVGKTADKGKAAITSLANAIGDLGLKLALVNAKLQNFEYNLNLTTQRQKALIQQNLASGTITTAQGQRQSTQADINAAQQRITQLTETNKEYQNIYNSLPDKLKNSLKGALLKDLDKAEIGDIERIVSDQSIYDNLDTNAKAALEARKKFLEGQTQIAQSQTELSTAQASLFETLKDFSRSYREFLLNAKRQLQDLQLQIERELLNYKYQLENRRNRLADLGLNNALESFRLELKKTIYQITTKTRGTVSTTFDGLLAAINGSVENAYENLRIDIQLKDTLNGFLQAIEEGLLTLTEQINQFTRNQEDRLQAARDIAISNPTGNAAPVTNGAVRWIENSASSSAAAGGHMGDDIFAPIGSRIFSPVAGTIVQSRVGGTKNTDDADPTKPGYQPQQLIVLKLDMPITFEGKQISYLNMRHLLSRNEDLTIGSKVNVGDFLGTVGEAGGSGTQFGSKNAGTAKDADASHLHIEYSPGENDQRNSLTDAQASRLTKQLSENYQLRPPVAGGQSQSTLSGGDLQTEPIDPAIPTGQMSQQDWLRWVAAQIGADPKDLAAIAALESARSFDSNIIGGAGNQYKGWIQLSPDAQRKLLGITDKNTQVTDEQYAKAVVRYFTEFRKTTFNPNRQNSIWDIYKEINPGYSRSTFMRDVGNPNAPYRRSGEEWLGKDTTVSSISVPAMGQTMTAEQAQALADYGKSNQLITEADAQRIANLRQHTAESLELYKQQAAAEIELANTRKENNQIANATELARQRKEIDQRLKDDQLAIDREKQRFATSARGYTELQTSVRDYSDQLDSLRQTQKEEEINFKKQAELKRADLLNAQKALADTETNIAKSKELNLSVEQQNELQQTRKRLAEVIIPLIEKQVVDNETLVKLSQENLKLGEAFLQREKAKNLISDIKNLNSTIDSVEDLKVNYGLLSKATADYDKGTRDLIETFAAQKIEIDQAIEKAKTLKENFVKEGDEKGVEKMTDRIKTLTYIQSELNKVLEKGQEYLDLNLSANKKTEQAKEIGDLNKYRSQLDQLYSKDMNPIDAAKYNSRNAQIEQQTSYLEESANIDRLAASGRYGSEQIQQMRSDLEELNQVKLGQINNEADFLMVKLKEIAVSGISGVLNGFYDWIRGTKDLGEAFREVAISILDQIAQIAIQIAVSGITGALFGTAQGKGSGNQIKSSGGPSPWMQIALSAASSFAGGFAKGGAIGEVGSLKSEVGSLKNSLPTSDLRFLTSFAKGGSIGETWTSWGGSKNWGSFETPLNKITPPIVLPIQPPPMPLPIPLLPQIPIFSLLSFAKGGNIGDAIANEKKYGKKPMLAVVHKGEQVLSTLDGEAQQYRKLKAILGDSPLSKIKMSFATGGDLLNEIGSRRSEIRSLRHLLPTSDFKHPTSYNRQSNVNINTTVQMPPGSTSALTAQQIAARNAEAARRALQRD